VHCAVVCGTGMTGLVTCCSAVVYHRYDLDNLVLDKIPDPVVHAVFELEAIMITGAYVTVSL